MNNLIEPIIWSLAPISELRGGIPIALYNGFSVYSAFFICVLANLLVIPIVFLFLDNLQDVFMKNRFYHKVFNKYIEKKRESLEKHIGTKWEFFALMLFVGIPLPITGAYTGSLLAWFFDVPRKKAYSALVLGVIMAGLIVSFVLVLGLRAFSIFIKNGF